MSESETREFPTDAAIYRHTETDDEVRYVGRDDDAYQFSINRGERTMALRPEDWPTYREFLEAEAHV